MRDVAFVVPVYNEASVIGDVIADILKVTPYAVCVNDGSRDGSAAEIVKAGAFLVDHPINMGQGAALQTGIEFARSLPGVNRFVTFDADGQHLVEDAMRMVALLDDDDVDIVLGSRFLGASVGASRAKKALLRAAVAFSNLTSGVRLTDAHNGLRAFNRHVADTIEITAPDMTHASEIVELIARNGYRYREVPVTIHYTEYSRSKGQASVNALNIAVDTLLRKVGRQ
ncbi:glycosyltransferase family 2 protein [Nocardioides xinjiangensis]|uniref:glycosyltransferase family 2 protein n=1 Tax=Nocardioides xinjiangensis TaxID=2817376 RepID=UPI001B30DCFE|nr:MULTISPECIES: glycosyltransferase family 2 protein [unclassified Nocardioides]